MDTMLRLINILLLLLSLSASAQTHPALSRFSVTVIPGGVFLEWTMIAGQTCNGTDILRLDENGEFIEIGEIEGVCGNVIEPENFSYLDSSPLVGQENEYRLRLGQIGTTTSVSAFYFDFNGAEAQIVQNIDGERITIIPREQSTMTAEVEVIDMQGRVVDSFYLFSTGSTEHSMADYQRGVYLLRIRRDGQLIFADRFVHY